MRDTQRQRVYDAENAALSSIDPRADLSLRDMQNLVDRWCADRVVRRHYRRAVRPLLVTDGRGRRTACYHPTLYGPDELRMPRWSRSRRVLLHEFAHALTFSYSRADHGWEFCACYLMLVRRFLGREAEATLMREFKARRVRYRRPRKRALTEEQRAAARERMLALNAQRR